MGFGIGNVSGKWDARDSREGDLDATEGILSDATRVDGKSSL